MERLKLSGTTRGFLTYVGTYLFLLVFFSLTVSTGDDWAFLGFAAQIEAGEVSLLNFIHGMYNTNGRILGNAFFIVSSSATLLSVALRALVMLGLVWAIFRLARLHSRGALLPVLLILLIPTVPTFGQSIGWTAGFTTYVAGTLIVMLLVLLLRDSQSHIGVLAVFATSVLAALFLETTTIALLIASVVLLAVQIRRRYVAPSTVSFILGTATGALLMFGSPAYHRIASGEDLYWPMPDFSLGTIGALSDRLAITIPMLAQHLAVDLAPLYLVLAVLFAAATFRLTKLGVKNGISLGSAVSLLLIRDVSLWPLPPGMRMLASVVTLILFLTYVLAILRLLWITEIPLGRHAFLFVLGGTASSIPLLLALPFGPRNFYLTAVFLVTAGLVIAAPWLNSVGESRNGTLAMFLASSITATVLAAMLLGNKLTYSANQELARQQYLIGSQEILLRNYPFPVLVWDGYNGPKLLRSLQELECGPGSPCQPVRDVSISWR